MKKSRTRGSTTLLHSFQGPLAIEGRKTKASRALRVTIPRETRDAMYAQGVSFPSWVRAQIDGSAPTFLFARRPKSRASVDFVLPHWRFPHAEHSQVVEVQVEGAERYRAPEPEKGAFDWAIFLQPEDDYFPTETLDGTLQLWNRYSPPFAIHRRPTHDLHWWFLGFYQAEGSKSKKAPDFTLAQKTPGPLSESIRAIETVWRIPRERMYLEVLYPQGKQPDPYVALYEPLGIEIAAVRERVDKRGDIGEEAGILHIKRSQPLVKLVKRALVALHEGTWTFPSKAAARAYALGWLDGDGGIVIDRRSFNIGLTLAGYPNEQKVVIDALEHTFEWKLSNTKFGTPRDRTYRTLRLDQAADLALAGAFPFSMNRARLIWALHQRLGWTPGNRSLTEQKHYDRATELFNTTLRDEYEALNQHPDASTGFNTGIKNAPYPQVRGVSPKT